MFNYVNYLGSNGQEMQILNSQQYLNTRKKFKTAKQRVNSKVDWYYLIIMRQYVIEQVYKQQNSGNLQTVHFTMECQGVKNIIRETHIKNFLASLHDE